MSEGKRQMPKVRELFSNKMYSDILYGYIQVNSEWDGEPGHPRILPKKLVNFSNIANYLGLTRQTVSKRFNSLINLKLLTEKENGDYEIVSLDSLVATLIDTNTLRVLVSAMNENCINIYIYFFSRWKAGGEQSFKFTYKQLKEVIGLGTKTYSNDYIVKDILNVLIKLGLIQVDTVTEVSDDGGYKTYLRIISVSDTFNGEISDIVLKI